MRAHSRSGQATSELMLLIAVVAVAVVAAGWLVAETFSTDMASLGDRAETVYTSGDLGR